MKIKKGDTVIILTGKDRGKEGKVLRALPKKGELIIEEVNMVTRHKKATRRGSQGQIVRKPMPVPVANVGVKDPKSGKPGRVGYITEGEVGKKKKVRIVRPSGEKI